MKILISHRYYWPDTPPYGLMLKVIAHQLAGAGHKVHVFSTIPSYHGTSEKAKGDSKGNDYKISTKRINVLDENRKPKISRPLNALWYMARLFIEIIKTKPDVVTASTFPPIVAALSAGLACKLIGAHFVYHLMDVYPEVAFINKKRNAIFRTLQRLDMFSISLAAKVIVLSPDMKASLNKRGIDNDKIYVLNNIEIRDNSFSELSYQQLMDKHKIKTHALTIGFAGNIGQFQGLDYIAELIEKTQNNPNINYIFMGSGRYKKTLKTRLQHLIGNSVFFLGHQPINVARTLMAGVDLNIVSLSPKVSACSYPSKTITIASEGGAFLILDEPNSSLANNIQTYNAGVTADHNQIEALASKLNEISEEPSVIDTFRNGSKRMYKECFAEEKTLHLWEELIGRLEQ